MNSKLSMVLIAALLALPLVGCDSKKGEKTEEKAEAEQAAAEKTEEKAEEKEEESDEMTVAQFSEKLVPTACEALDTCKNEKLKAGASAMVMMTAGFGAMGDKDFAKKVKPVQDAMKKDERSALTGDECNTVLGAFSDKTGMDGETLSSKVGKTIEFDAAKAEKCLAGLESIKACEEEVKLEGKMKMQELDKVLKESKFQESLQVCEGVMKGTLKEGDECEYTYECSGDALKCAEAAADAKKGEKAEKPKEGDKVAAKTCQKKQAPGAPGKPAGK
jgi:hypothetical protein